MSPLATNLPVSDRVLFILGVELLTSYCEEQTVADFKLISNYVPLKIITDCSKGFLKNIIIVEFDQGFLKFIVMFT
jgi:hypothetical protein